MHRSPDRCAIRYYESELTAAEVDQAASALASALQRRGVIGGSRVGLSMQNIPLFPICLLALWKLSAIAVPFNPMYRGAELRRLADDAEVLGMIVERELEEPIRESLANGSTQWTLTVSDDELRDGASTSSLFVSADPADRDQRTHVTDLIRMHIGEVPQAPGSGSDDVALICYTSGTTGPPKGAIVSHANLLHSSRNFGNWVGLVPGDAVLAIAPLFHITGLSVNMAISLFEDTTLILTGRFEAESVIEAISRHKVKYTVGSITAFNAFLRVPWATSDHFASLTSCYSGGAPVPPATVTALHARFGLTVRNAWGMTETTAGGIATPVHLSSPVDESGTLSIGVPMQNVNVRIVNPDGRDVEPGQPGELEFDAPQTSRGYWRNDDATAFTFPEGRLRTGDVAVMDERGWVYLVDRLKDVINVSGYKVWPREVEDVLYEHPDVFEAAVVGEPDEYRGETVVAYVSVAPGTSPTPDGLIRFAKERLAAYKYPRRIHLVDELPKTASGKIRRSEIRVNRVGPGP
ncbi:class I adenylate-forming enzyme family protein [Gordonia terrae]|uniref:class I adenylate-forming enzyme family protein n=1 Tax=Gordonia terrae TaxID=2055 RepID=UPI0027E2FCCA|nr:AMP-binding protein [Gordonia terrae]